MHSVFAYHFVLIRGVFITFFSLDFLGRGRSAIRKLPSLSSTKLVDEEAEPSDFRSSAFQHHLGQ